MSPPGNEKGPLQGALLSDDTETLEQSPRRVNGKPTPPEGTAWADTLPNEPKRFEVTAPILTPREVSMLRVIREAASWCKGSTLKWCAFEVAIAQDDRSAAEIAQHLKCSKRNVEINIKAAREWLSELRAELKSEGA